MEAPANGVRLDVVIRHIWHSETPAGTLSTKPKLCIVRVGVATRTENKARPRWRGGFAEDAACLAAQSNPTIRPGAARHVQGESLKAADLSSRQVATPRLPVRHRRDVAIKPRTP
ncbi:MAG: hypothetical protein JWO33_19 [Caulobacteraceae bacterium]|nr:hypothetical protein [Caulobacteraceae bacterium]